MCSHKSQLLSSGKNSVMFSREIHLKSHGVYQNVFLRITVIFFSLQGPQGPPGLPGQVVSIRS